ncbi:MAG: cytidylate kinase-like family protein [Anaerolineae bacterium]|jgi:cytidylate kinase|nr:cytidylate kinase-like family protein [Anaerolineae bacterium]
MAVITISREYGSRGMEIAGILCDRLGYRYFDKHLMVQLGAPEELKAALVSADAPSELGDERGALWHFFHNLQASSPIGQAQGARTNEALPVDIVERGIRVAYREDNVVVVGRGGQVVLQGLPDVLHARVVAPLQNRIDTSAHIDGLPLDAARQRVLAQDRAGTDYIRNTYRLDPTDPTLYNMVVNTGRMTPEACADTIISALKHIGRRPS